MTKTGFVFGLILTVVSCSTVYAQDNVFDSRDEIYIPKNLPDVVITKQEATNKFSLQYNTYPNLKFSVMTDPLLLLFFGDHT